LEPKWRKEKPAQLVVSLINLAGLESGDTVQALLGLAMTYEKMEDLLAAVLLGEEADVARMSGKTVRSGAVTLMTLHGAKGLEFPVVFLDGATQNVLPLDMPGRTGDIQEERRLFFVGLTRAKEELLILSGAQASPFMREIPADLLNQETLTRKSALRAKQLSFF
jgi:superfamily I DNA/RNA helicase